MKIYNRFRVLYIDLMLDQFDLTIDPEYCARNLISSNIKLII